MIKRLLILFLFFSHFVIAQNINFPDANFKAFLLSCDTIGGGGLQAALNSVGNYIKIDSNSDGEIQLIEASNVITLQLDNCTQCPLIADLTGIKSFSNLKNIGGSGGNLNINFIDLSGMISITDIQLPSNVISNLNLSGLTQLQTCMLVNNKINSVNFSGCSNLNYLRISNNQLTNLDLTDAINLGTLDCQNNSLINLDLSNLKKSCDLNCSNNLLTYLNLKNGVRSDKLTITNNPNLQFICVDEKDIFYLNQLGNIPSNVSYNSYCSFVPGGKYNTIKGTFIFDTDNNGCDINDNLSVKSVKTEMQDSSNIISSTFTDDLNHYKFYSLVGDYKLTPKIENNTLFKINPINDTITFIDSNFNVINRDFCISANTPTLDLEIVFAPILEAQSGVDAKYEIIYKNKGNQTLSGQIKLTYPNTLTTYISSTFAPTSTNSGVINWDFASLQPFETRRIELLFHTNNISQNPAVNIGDTLPFEVSISPISDDFSSNDNHFKFNQIVVDTLSPYLISCLEGRVLPTMNVSDYLHYKIEFENLTTDTISNVIIRQIIDTVKFNISSLQILNSSFPVYSRIEGNKVEFIYEEMALGDHNHGNILFKLKTRDTLTIGDTLNKSADIYFDYDLPIQTNNSKTTFQKLTSGLNEKMIDQSISVFPNPSNGVFNIRTENQMKQLEVFDASGRLLIIKIGKDNSSKIDITNQEQGIYFLKITTNQGVKVIEVGKN